MVMQSAFNASWPATADGRWFRLEEEHLGTDYSKQCIDALQRTGYLTASKKAVKFFLRDTETALPLVCDKKSIAQRVAERQVPHYYGHRHAYGNHQELVKAKYFTDKTVTSVEPLQPNSFAKEILGITTPQSQTIWQLLTKAGYVVADQQQNDLATAVGKPGESFLRDIELLADLKALNEKYVAYLGPIKELVMLALSQRKVVSLADFVETFLHWLSVTTASSSNQQEGVAQQIGRMLINKGYLPSHLAGILKVLNKRITSVLGPYTHFIPEIVRVLCQRFSHRLGTAAFDVESYKIDANGNHRLFYTGFNRYEFAYREGTSQIQSIKSGWDSDSKIFSMQHDAQGNVIRALHAGVETIDYHPTSQRTTRMKLTDGRSLHFHYDAQGERVLKRVLHASGQVSHETYYLRDEKGRVLVDQRVQYSTAQPDQKVVTVTAYLYGPRGLLGFIRNDAFYSVMTDHAGSIRLVIRDGQVVAAYDYLPYGGLMRSFGSDPQSQIVYRFTGQEWDEETGLYNFHARLYDPRIGRFFQPDPQSQYFSPYKYAGNSPVSLVDPDGEFAITLGFIIFGAVVGTYLGGAAANNRWNPLDWDFEDSSTYTGMIAGGVAGAMLPINIAGSVSAIGVLGTIGAGVTGSYLITATANDNWAPWKWQWDRPHTFNALLEGFSAGTGLVKGVNEVKTFADKFIGIKKNIFLAVSYSSGGALAYGSAVMSNNNQVAFWEWDFSKPATWAALADGFDAGFGWPKNILELKDVVTTISKNRKEFVSLLAEEGSICKKVISIITNPKNPFYKTTSSLVMMHFMGRSSSSDLDITRWNLATVSTYEGVLNGLFYGQDTSNMLRYATESRTKKPSNNLPYDKLNIKRNNWQDDFVHLLDHVKFYLKKLEYKRLVENCFSTDAWRSKLKDEPESLRRNVENFLNHGLEQFSAGKIQPPAAFHQLLLLEAEQNVRGSSQLLTEWQQESEYLSMRQRKIFPDEDAQFFSCVQETKLKKRRTTNIDGCVIPNLKSSNLLENKEEIFYSQVVKYHKPKTSSRAKRSIEASPFNCETSSESEIIKSMTSGAVQNRPWTNKIINKIVTLLGGVRWKVPTPFSSLGSRDSQRISNLGSAESAPEGLNIVSEYTVHHLQGSLLLADLLIRKVSGENYRCTGITKIDPLDESEARLQASLQKWGHLQ